jgi:hypothetical protein
MRAEKTLEAIDAALTRDAGTQHRWHLGASVIGRPCGREIWYNFKWARDVKPKPRILRLFDRGHREEERIVAWLRAAGIAVSEKTADGEQYRVMDETGHFGGSLDALVFNIPELPGEEILAEFKTHSDKSFANLSARGMKAAKPEHFVQMCVYMGERGLSHGLYIGVNKNDDELHLEIVEYDADTHRQASERAHAIINSDESPPRISDTPTFWICRSCNMQPICHGTTTPDINCRTCAHVAIGPNGTWTCTKHGHVFTKELEELDAALREQYESATDVPPLMRDGCADHVFNPHMLNGVEFLGGNEAENYTTLRFKCGTIVENGPTRTPSDQICLSDPSPIKKKPSPPVSRTSTRKKKTV